MSTPSSNAIGTEDVFVFPAMFRCVCCSIILRSANSSRRLKG